MSDPRQQAVDAQVATIIQASGGWNARARARLAFYAATRRIEPWRVAAAVRRAASGGLTGASKVGAANSGAAIAGAAPSGVAGSSVPRAAAASSAGTAPSRVNARLGSVLAAGALVIGVALTIALLWVAADQVVRAREERAQRAAGDSDVALESQGDPSSDGARAGVDGRAGADGRAGTSARATPNASSNTSSTSPSSIVPSGLRRTGRSVPTPPAVFPRPPVLVGDLSTRAVREALETVSANEATLERLSARGAPPDPVDQDALTRLAEAFLECWPVLDRARATAILSALARSEPQWPTVAREALGQSLATARDDPSLTLRAWWRGAGAAGLQAMLEDRTSQGATASFASGALAWLRARAPAISEAAVRVHAADMADLCDGWVAALDSAGGIGSNDESLIARDSAVLAAIEALLRSNGALDRPGTPAAAAGTLLDAVPWTAGHMRRDRVVEAWKQWCADETITSLALHGLTSVLAARRPGTWWDPWLVVDARASMADRQVTADLLAPALSASMEVARVAAPALRGVDPQLLARWRAVSQLLAGKTEPASDAERVARAAEWLALVEAARMLERGRASDADARLSQLEAPAGLSPDPQDRWRDGPPTADARLPASDGALETELRKPRPLEDRLNIIRALRTRPIRDLGPRDAETLAREALASPSSQVRGIAQAVIVDVFAQGPNVLAAVLAELHACAHPSEAAQMAGSLVGLAPPRGTDSAMRTAAGLLVVDVLTGLLPSDRHALDTAARELALTASATARALGGSAPAVLTPEAAMQAWAVARTNEAQRTVPPEVLAQVLNRPAALRQGTRGAPQRFVADQTLVLEVDAAMLIERFPRRRTEVQAVLQRASAARTQARDVFAQVDANARAMAELAAIALGVDGGGA